MSNNDNIIVIGAVHYDHDKETIKKLGYEFVRYSEYINDKPRWAELRKVEKNEAAA